MKFEDLLVWQSARKLVSEIYKLMTNEQLNHDFGLKSQLQRSAISIMSNIAEGFERKNIKEKNHFYNIARASCGETRSLIYVVLDNYPETKTVCEILFSEIDVIGKMITGLIKSTSKRSIS